MALNPISFTEQVVSDFLRYQLTTHPLADRELHAQMRALLRLEESRAERERQAGAILGDAEFERRLGRALHELWAAYPRRSVRRRRRPRAGSRAVDSGSSSSRRR